MPLSVRTLYDSIPYDVLADPKLGPLSTGACRKDVDARYALLARQGRRSELRAAWDDLIKPGKRVGWDVFCSAADRGQDALRKLVDEVPTVRRGEPQPPALDLLPDLIDWESVLAQAQPVQLTPREMGLGLSGAYDDPEAALRRVDLSV